MFKKKDKDDKKSAKGKGKGKEKPAKGGNPFAKAMGKAK